MRLRRVLPIFLIFIVAIELLALVISVLLLDKWNELMALGVFVQSLATCVMVYFSARMVELTRESTEMRGKLYVNGLIIGKTENSLSCEITLINRARLAQTILYIYASTGKTSSERITLDNYGTQVEINAGQQISDTFTATTESAECVERAPQQDSLISCDVWIVTAYDNVKHTLYDPTTPQGLYRVLKGQ